jgi:hypothetical protein
MKCTSCGADIPLGQTVCEYCNSAAEPITAKGNRAWRFAQVKQSAEFAQRQRPERLAALPRSPSVGNAVAIGFLIVWTLGAGFVMVMAWTMAGMAGSHFGPVGLIPLGMSVVPMGFVALGIFMLVKTIQKAGQYSAAPIRADAALIVGKRTQVSGGSGDSSASTGYFVTAEFEDGRRLEFQAARPDLFGRLAEGDAGVLFSRTDVALDFDRVSEGNEGR